MVAGSKAIIPSIRMRKSKSVKTGLLVAFIAGTLVNSGCSSQPDPFPRPLIYRDHPRIQEADEKRERERSFWGGSYGFWGWTGSRSAGASPSQMGSGVERGGFGGTSSKLSSGS